MASMAAEPIWVRSAGSAAVFTRSRKASRTFRTLTLPLSSGIGDCQLMDDKNEYFKELGMFSLRNKIEDAVLHAEMSAPAALELEEARRIKQEELIRDYNLWDDPAKSNEILVNLGDSSKVVDALKDIAYKAEEAKLIKELAEVGAVNSRLFRQAYAASQDISKFLCNYELSKCLRGAYDMEGACIVIEAGPEDTYSEMWAEQLMNMYLKWAEKQGYTGRVVEVHHSKDCGIRSAAIEFEFKYAYGYLSGETGTHRMINSSHSGSVLLEEKLAAVDVIPLFLESAPDVIIDEKDLMITSSAAHGEVKGQMKPVIYVQHRPTGLLVQSSGERSHFANKVKAVHRLKAKLLTILRDRGILSVTRIKRGDVVDIWNQETRRYVSHPNKLVQDVRTGVQLPELNSVLDGNIQPLVAAHINFRRGK